MASQVILKKSSVAARVPVAGDLAYGELALNYADGLLYFKKSDGVTIAAIGTGSGTVTSVAALTLGTSGTDVSSTVATGTTAPVITLNIPTASASNRGVLSAADWTTFNGKQAAGSYLTAEADTLATVTTRGNITTNAIKVGGKSTIGTGPLTGSTTYTLAIGQSSSSNVPTIAFSTQVIGNAVPETVIAKLIALDTNATTTMAGYASISLTSGITGQLGKGQIIFHTSDEVTPEAISNTMTEKVRIAYNGYLGVGTPTPTQRLEVAGTIYSTSGGFKFPDNTTQTTAVTASGTNTGDETTATIKTKLGITTLSGSNTGDQTLPTTLPASDVYTWAKAATKPSYTYSEISSTPTTLPNPNALTFATTGGATAGSTYTGAAVLTVDYATVGAAAAGHTHSYQAADADLLAIGGLTGTSGYLKKTAADTWTLDTSTFLTSTISDAITLSYGTANGVAYLNGSKVLTSGTALVFDGTNLGIGTTSPSTYGKFAVTGSLGTFAVEATGAVIKMTRAGTNYLSAPNGDLSYNGSTHTFTNGAAATTYAVIDSSGNLGLGVTPSAWDTAASVRAIQLPSGVLWNYNSAGSSSNIFLGNNYYWNGTNRIYIATGTATEYQQLQGQHRWWNAPSGTAGAAITFTQAMTLDASGNLLVGTTTAYGSGTTITPTFIYSSTSGNVSGIFDRTTSNGDLIHFRRQGTTVGSLAVTATSVSLLGSNGIGLTVDSAGAIGIGQAVPTQKLEVAGTIYSTSGGFKFPDGTTQTTASTGSSGGGTTGVTNITRTVTGNGSQTTFTVTSGVTVNSLLITENGVLQTPTTDYTVSGTTLTFVTAPASGVAIQIRELGSLGTQESLSPFMLMGA